MNDSERRDRIVEYLRIKPISHGQIYTFQIAVPQAEVVEIPSQRREALSRSLAEQGSNLVPLIVRRTEAYSEEEEYEVVYGADWCLLAKELEIEKLWVWVFNMTDEQAAAAKAEMQQLVGGVSGDGEISPVVSQPKPANIDIESVLDKKLQPITAQLNRLLSLPQNTAESSDNGRLGEIESKIQTLTSIVEKIAGRVDELITTPPKISPQVEPAIAPAQQPKPSKLNLLEASDSEIKGALYKVRANDNHINAALKAIKYWKSSPEGLSWDNLAKSTKSGKLKIKDFANGTYQKLKDIGDLPS